ncbi:NADH-quinone oxidoreductase subunit E [Mycolicibacterium hassiacum DSM 44199]|jgi:NADH-quinone oxidoreductase subunit E|uniref:NADH-quinone oxidoreductase subunit E n=1 Tax=Mycolicibacterium hassiacum (strain DSM 44199 / CIP 105218 / JCM 12690 / 3849) TaxID=1122247 RepID=K5BBS3_MYCHD|nr:NADH-quinone oxidoreductase subunit NuoE [Mycolicibacterium hassiacum]EKF24490.1 NADH-quinone oxidoreductase subunit E [Mycolicibacterium hassiacum DSM 44199]MBX5485057.1 NADH-quinone oxidoreductase subunit NuoE [Mycolicibacterium hassiacum]MDA4084386.1 NADH dehydrogenase subunit E [Mycolicibacterium hassiacum DSM 44199]PZN25102.1 MAG: NADH-quinone oxidoreductase subunit NuoE [Mycolicibacterium hassiacum]VCT88933.1 NADH-quinone oxidoreductase subunit E [Mycolicibacterium hassiacum DSM 44199
MSVFLELGQRPDEPGPPIHGRKTYPADVVERLRADAEKIIARYPQSRSALLPLLHLVQSEDGCLTPAGIAFCAEQLGLTDAEITAVATFYSMYRRTPTGDYLVGVCTNTLCAIMGGDAILEELENHLGIHAGETTADGRITLEHVECNAACDYAPVVMVNWEFFDNQTPSSARELVDALRAGQTVTPSRGAPLCTFRQTARILAGLPDPDGTAAQGGPGDATLAGLRIARANGMHAPEAGTSGPNTAETDPKATDSDK